jgi:pimeloyl-ACP methyl ester carboxylesterase
MKAQSRYVTLLDREVHYMEWGAPDAPALIMWHGLARTGRDFDDLAEALCDRWRILVPDTIGRGLSQWSPRPRPNIAMTSTRSWRRPFSIIMG